METAELVGLEGCGATPVAQLHQGGLWWHDLAHQAPSAGDLHLEHEVASFKCQLPHVPAAGPNSREQVSV
jgi:hypothetical protein